MLKLASLLLAFFLVAQPALVQAQSLTLNRVKSLLVDAGFKDSRVEDDIVVVDGLGRFGTQIAVGLSDDKSNIMLSTNWTIPAEKQNAIPALEMLAANSYSPFVFALVGEDKELSLNIEATFDSSLVSKSMLRKAVEQMVETIDSNEKLWNSENWPDIGGSANPEAAKPEAAKPEPSAPAPAAPPAAVASKPVQPLALPRLLFVSREAKSFGDIAPRPGNAFAQGEPMLIYMEAAGLTVSPAEAGQNRVLIAVDSEARNWSQQVVRARATNLDDVVTFEGAESPPLFVTSTTSFNDLPPGAYIYTVYLRDKTSGRTAQADLPFTITSAATPPAVATAPDGAAPPAKAPVPEKPKQAAAPPAKPTIAALGNDGLVAQGLRAPIDTQIVAVPRIEIRGTSMTSDDLAKVLDPAASGSVWDRVLGITAREITIPEIRIESADDVANVVVLRDVRLTEVAQGRIGSLIVGNGSVPSGNGGDVASFVRLDVAGLDLALLSSLSAPAKDGATEPKPAYRSFAIEGLAVGEANADGFRVSRIASRDVRVRPLAAGWAAVLERAMPLFDDKASGQAHVAALNPLADLLEAFEPGSLELTGIEIVSKTPDPNTFRIARVGLTTDRDGPGEVRADGLAIGTRQGPMRMASFAVEGISLRSAIRGMRAIAGSGATEITAAAGRRLLPEIRTIRFGGYDAELANTETGPVKFSIGSAELGMSDPIDGVPTSLRFSINNFTMPIDSAKGIDATGQIGNLGYQVVGLTGRLDLGWNETAQQIVVREISIDGAEMGSVVARGVIANVSKDIFNPSSPIAAVALLGSAVASLELEIEDKGLLQRALAAQAAQSGETVETIRTGVASIATLAVTAQLGDRPEAKALGQAVGRFLAKPGRLFISVKAKQPPGLGAADFQAAADPAALLDKVDIVAESR